MKIKWQNSQQVYNPISRKYGLTDRKNYVYTGDHGLYSTP